MCQLCNGLVAKHRVGYKGQKYAVFYTRDGERKLFGWQNQPDGGLMDVAKLMPGVTSVEIEEIPESERHVQTTHA